MKRYKYKSYKEYLDIQYKINKSQTHLTIDKAFLRAEDINNIKSIYKGRKCLCLGCRHDSEVDDFIKNGFDAIGIDILLTKRQIRGDINNLENYFSENSFDLAYSCHSLEHTKNPIHFLKMVRKICIEGIYLVIPIKEEPSIEEPAFFNIMYTKNVKDIKELEIGLGKFTVQGHWILDDYNLPSGPEMAFALKWKI